jgi:Uma2 family endonuclease
LGAYAEPLSLALEVWSWTEEPYDFEAKLHAYRERGDEEIWYIHPFERTLAAWRRQPDAGFAEDKYRGGFVPVVSLPGVTINLDAILEP